MARNETSAKWGCLRVSGANKSFSFTIGRSIVFLFCSRGREPGPKRSGAFVGGQVPYQF